VRSRLAGKRRAPAGIHRCPAARAQPRGDRRRGRRRWVREPDRHRRRRPDRGKPWSPPRWSAHCHPARRWGPGHLRVPAPMPGRTLAAAQRGGQHPSPAGPEHTFPEPAHRSGSRSTWPFSWPGSQPTASLAVPGARRYV